MELKQLRHFLAVIETGSFHKAAARVNVTQQAISRSIQRLEQECGGRLLERKKGDRRKVGPSPFGLLLIPRAQKALAEIGFFRDEIETLMGTGRNLVRLGATPTAARALLPGVVHAFHNNRRQARIQVMQQSYHVVLEQLTSGLYEIAVCDEPEEGLAQHLTGEPLYVDHNVFVVRNGHPLLARGRLMLRDLDDCRWVMVGPFCRLWNELRDMYVTEGLTPAPHHLDTNSLDLALHQLREDDCVAYLPARLIGAEIESGQLARLPVRQPKARQWHCLLVKRRDATLGVMLSQFSDALRKAARRLPRL